MIQKYLKIQASPADVKQEMLKYEAWPEWWPGMQSVKLIKNDPALSVVDTAMNMVMNIKMTLEVDCRGDDVVKFKQTKGWFKSYTGDWTFLPAPDGDGTTFKITTKIATPITAPKGMVYKKLSAALDDFGGSLNKRLQGKPKVSSTAEPNGGEPDCPRPPEDLNSEEKPEANARKLFHGPFQTKKGLEFWINGRPYYHLMKPA